MRSRIMWTKRFPTQQQLKEKSVYQAIALGISKSKEPAEVEKEFTCNKCPEKGICKFAWDLHNLHGDDCLKEKK